MNCSSDPISMTCVRVWTDGDPMGPGLINILDEVAPDSACLRPNSDSFLNEMVEGMYGLIPAGTSVNLTEYCAGEGGSDPDEEPYTEDTVAVGWYDHCREPDLATCEEIRVDARFGFMYNNVDSSVCDAAIGNQTEEQLALVRDSGDLIPGNYDWEAHCAGETTDPEPDPCDVIPIPGGPGIPIPGGPGIPIPGPGAELGGPGIPIGPPPGCEPDDGDPTDPSDPDDGIPGLTSDPDLLVGSGDPPFCGAFGFEWETGAWQGSAQCGSGGTLSRQVSCVALVNTAFCGEEDGPVIAMSYDGSMPNSLFGGQDLSLEAEGQMILAQFGPPIGGEIERVVVDPSYCMGALISPPPPTNYTGDEAGCEYSMLVSEGEWFHPFGGSATCSSEAVREKTMICLNSSGDVVDDEYCILDLREGGQFDPSQLEPDIGNFESCSYSWQQETYSVGCHTSGNPTGAEQGPVHYERVEYECLREDGMPASDESQCGPKPTGAEYVVAGSCVKTFDQSVWDGMCPGHDPGNYTQAGPAGLPDWRTVVFPGSMYGGGAQACVDAGSTCCEQRWNQTLGRTETVGSNQPVSRHRDWFTGTNPSYRLDDGDGPNVHYGTTTYSGDETLHDHGLPKRITGAKNGYTCSIPVGTVKACGIPFGCATESVSGGPQKCEPSTAYWRFDNEVRVLSQGASGVKWVPED